MKTLALLLLALPLFAKWGGTVWLDETGIVVANGQSDTKVVYDFSYDEYGVKTLDYSVYFCPQQPFAGWYLGGLKHPTETDCLLEAKSIAEKFNFVKALLNDLKSWANGAPSKANYGTLARQHPLSFSTVQPSPPPAPTMVFVDSLGGDFIQLDLTSGAILKEVSLPSSAIGPVAARPSKNPVPNEFWVANQSPQVTIVDLAGQTVLANIAMPSILSPFVAVGMAFSNSGATAFEAVRFDSPDASGNNGALLVFDAVKDAVTSTFPLKYGPAAMLMAPDALTVYLLSQSGQLTYYDVLSGTADLSVSTYTPGSNGGYPGTSNAFVHPDGTRLFWNVGTYLTVFDLTSRKVIAQFNSGLPTTSAVTLEVSQDGSTATMSNGAGMVVVLDTRYGIVQATSQNATATLAFPGN